MKTDVWRFGSPGNENVMQRFLLSADDTAQALGDYLIASGKLENITEDQVVMYEQYENNVIVVTVYSYEEANEENLL